MKKQLVVVIGTLAFLLGACGTDKKNTEEKPKVEEQTVDLTEAATEYKTSVLVDLKEFVEDVKLLQTYITEGKLEEATKLYPLLHMNIEKLKPLQTQFQDQFLLIDSPIEEGKELEGKGLHAIEYGLFVKKDTNAVKTIADDLLKAASDLINAVAKENINGKQLLTSTEKMISYAISDKLGEREKNIGNTQVYDVKGNVDALTQVMQAFKHHVAQEELNELEGIINAVNEEIAFYEVGKEDYVNFSYFTNNQKQQLTEQLKQLEEGFVSFTKSIK